MRLNKHFYRVSWCMGDDVTGLHILQTQNYTQNTWKLYSRVTLTPDSHRGNI